MHRHDPSTTTRDAVRLPAPVLARAQAASSATLHEAARKIGALPSPIQALAPGFRCAGSALTVHSPPGDNLWLHRALERVQPGDVMVVFTGGAHEHGYWGEIMATMAKARGLAGLVIDGCVRDGDLLREIGVPTFSRGLCIRGTGKDFGAVGWINHPVLIGDVVVNAGDLIVGDGDGVVSIPHYMAGAVLDAGAQRDAEEAEFVQRLQRGESTLSIYGWR